MRIDTPFGFEVVTGPADPDYNYYMGVPMDGALFMDIMVKLAALQGAITAAEDAGLRVEASVYEHQIVGRRFPLCHIQVGVSRPLGLQREAAS